MARTFFENQIEAKRKSNMLIWLYVGTVTILIVSIYFIFLFTLGRITHDYSAILVTSGSPTPTPFQLWDPALFLVVSASAILIISVGSLYKINQLKSGGRAVAEMLGGRLVQPNTTDPQERRIINVVEEIAIASGLHVPPVYILHEPGINAFAAGLSPNQAVIGISSGATTYLTRDELQGVIAHEFSHILNGDMTLNIKLIGVLHGILLIAIIGRTMMGSVSHRSYRNNNDSSAGLLLFFAGSALMILGFIGMFFAKLIKMAVSRQREFLADASAIQFTRNPDGIGGALKKIGGLAAGSAIDHPQAEEVSHFFFADGLSSTFSKLFSTHPPLEDRIKRIDPYFDGRYPKTALSKPEQDSKKAAKPINKFGVFPIKESTITAQMLLTSIGTISQDNISQARAMISELPALIREQAHEPLGARVIAYCLLLDEDPITRKHQLNGLLNGIDPVEQQLILKILPSLEGMAPDYRLPVLDMILPTLQLLSPRQYRDFRSKIESLIKADGKLSLFEFIIRSILLRKLDRYYEGPTASKSTPPDIATLLPPTQNLLASLALLGNQEPSRANLAYQAGADHCGIAASLRYTDVTSITPSLELLEQALNQIASAEPTVKEKIIKACLSCINADGLITSSEAELIRAITEILECPLPILT